MNRITKNLFLAVYPFYPIWAWVMVKFVHFPPDKLFIFLLLPILIYNIWNLQMRVPAYLWFFIFFTLYHLGSVYYWGLLPTNTNWIFFFFSDINVFACVLFLVIENTDFDDGFIKIMSRNIFIIMIISMIVSIIQIKNNHFFYYTEMDDDAYQTYAEDNRNASIYSWLGFNSVGVTFPIMLAIMLNEFDYRSKQFPFIALSGIIVPFLTRARYVMISAIIAFMQLLLIRTIPIKKKFTVIMIFIMVIFGMIGVAQMAGYDINKVIDERILEKGNDMGSAKTRVLSFEVFKMKFPEHPYFGVGPKTRDDVIDLLGGEAIIIHVGYLSYLYYYGALGASLLFIALVLLLREAWLTGRRHQFWGSFYGLLGFALANATFVYFFFGEMGIVLAVIYMRYYNLRSIRLYEEMEETESEFSELQPLST